MLEGRGPDLSDRRLSRPTSASFVTARLGNAAPVIALALALGIAGDLTLAATNSEPMLADTDLTPVAAPDRRHRLACDLRDCREPCGARACGAEPPFARLHGGRPLCMRSHDLAVQLVPSRVSYSLVYRTASRDLYIWTFIIINLVYISR